MLLKNGINLSDQLSSFLSNSESLVFFVPYIKLNSLAQLLDKITSCRVIVVRWEPRDLIINSSDLEIYPYCRERGITLYRNSRIHLKAFVDDYKRAIIGSANISSRGLNIPETTNFNYELATLVENLTLEDRLYFHCILNESTLITDSIFEQLRSQLPQKKREFPNEDEFRLKVEIPDKSFLISSLPMLTSVGKLVRVYQERSYSTDEELNCFLHDLALYNIPLGLSREELQSRLKQAFFAHPFIEAFLQNLSITKEIYFGAAKDWIHKNCTNVPVPRKWEITENIQILYRWIVELGDGKYAVDRPNYSERLKHIS